MRTFSTRPSTARRTVVAGLVTGAVLALAVPAMASAHVTVSPDELAAGDHGTLTFAFSHGCEDSPTTALRITMPEGLASVAPTIDPNWTIDVERGDDGLVSAVTYTAVAPVANGLRGAVTLGVGLDDSTPDTLVFPVVQSCVVGSTEWTQVAEDGEDPHGLDAPAPVVTVGEATGGHGEHGEHDAAGSDESATASGDTDAGGDGQGALGVAFGAGGLVAGVAALVVSILAFRRRA
ncbi:YcnI family copper-binding membrane protein [Microbacterium sp. GCS4]|uniref:YcnI family copper-binding membrane protein n=1 Tax=Microbacterium sp. GCS4 TaxID=1692239 RepID=UPI0006830BB7|nr:YcnI family protein [Microbacterium sp. GCS4]KNY07326.1 hypothetical protein AKH00_03305 [Microbacterium sp. GCS4]